jgi:hypothetical protein
MSQILGQLLFQVWLAITVALWVVLFVTMVIGWIVPNTLQRSVFCEPHFTSVEISFIGGIPFGFIRAFMLMRLVNNPAAGSRRGLTDLRRRVPVWFRRISSLLLPLFYGLVFCFTTLLLLLSISALLSG